MALVVKLALSLWAGTLAVQDWRFHRLPNYWLLAGLIFATAYALLYGEMPLGAGWLEALIATAIVLVCFVPLYAMKWMGAGDVKFLAVIAWLGGLPTLLGVLLYGSLLAGVIALFLIYRPYWAMSWPVVSSTTSSRRRIPYGTCLALALIPQIWGWLAVPALPALTI
ncbi:MAG: prepilin peptidase [Thiohalomonadaceae bacterium]|jgi:prepilin peptidase CpaA